MSRFGDLLSGESVDTPPVVDTAPASVEPEVEEEKYESDVSFSDMSKDELEDYGRTVGIELDRRHNKKKLVKELEDHLESE
tara:strand:- start:507 stop:749 length:243 start_codon:yes stop_codon:yes gene_type:complete